VWLVGVVSVWQAEAQCGDTIEDSQGPDDGCINVRNMLSIEEVKNNIVTSDIKLVSYSSTITMMHGTIYIRFTKIILRCTVSKTSNFSFFVTLTS